MAMIASTSMNPGIPSFLQQVPFFSSLSAEACAHLERRTRRRDFVPQTVIVRQESSDGAAYFILSGRVAVRRTDPDTGVDFVLAELGAGQMFGEMAMLTGQPRTASVLALEDTTCAVLEHADFELVLATHPEVASAMLRMLAERLVEANRAAGIDFVNLAKVQIDPRVVTLLPQALINAHRVVPISFANNRLTLAMTNPNNLVAFDDVRRAIKGVLIEPAIVTEDDFKRFMSSTYPQLLAKTATPPRPAKDAASPPEPVVDLLQADLIRELQLAADTDVLTADTKQ